MYEPASNAHVFDPQLGRPESNPRGCSRCSSPAKESASSRINRTRAIWCGPQSEDDSELFISADTRLHLPNWTVRSPSQLPIHASCGDCCSCRADVNSMLECRLIRTSALPAYVSLPSRTIPAVCPRIPQTIDHKDRISDYPLKTARFGVV